MVLCGNEIVRIPAAEGNKSRISTKISKGVKGRPVN
jgi:hypothetical protein